MSQYYCIPERTIETLKRYVDQRNEPGQFVRAVLENNLKESMARADLDNRVCMFEIVQYVYNELPGICWGTPEKVHKWLANEEN